MRSWFGVVATAFAVCVLVFQSDPVSAQPRPGSEVGGNNLGAARDRAQQTNIEVETLRGTGQSATATKSTSTVWDGGPEGVFGSEIGGGLKKIFDRLAKAVEQCGQRGEAGFRGKQDFMQAKADALKYLDAIRRQNPGQTDAVLDIARSVYSIGVQCSDNRAFTGNNLSAIADAWKPLKPLVEAQDARRRAEQERQRQQAQPSTPRQTGFRIQENQSPSPRTRTFVLPHVLERSGSPANTSNAFDTSIFVVYAGGSAGVSRADTRRGCTRSASAGALDECAPGDIFAPNTSFAGGVLVGVTGPTIPAGPVQITTALEFEALFPSGSATSNGTPVTNLGPPPIGDTYEVRDRNIMMLSGIFGVPIAQNVTGLFQIGGAWIDKEITYNCNGAPNGFCGIAPATPAFSQTQSLDLTGLVVGGGVQGRLPPIFPNQPSMYWRFLYTHIFVDEQTVSFGTDATRSVTYNVSQDIDIARGQLILPIVDPGAFRTLSDIRLKRDIARVGTLDSGLLLYRYKYLWSEQVYVGVMAQEVADVVPDAVVKGDDGYLRVNYARLGTSMMTWEQWSAERSWLSREAN